MNEKMKILMAYDGSEYADAAIEDLQYAGLPNEVEAVVLSVGNAWELPEIADSVYSRPDKPTLTRGAAVQKHLAEVIERTQTLSRTGAERVREIFPDWGVTAEARVGKPAWEVIIKSDEWQPELVIVGPKGCTALGRLFLGSVSQKVLTESHCSVRISRRRTNDENAPLRILIAVDGSTDADAAVKAVARRQWADGTEFRLITADDDVFSRATVGLIDSVPEGNEDSEEAKEWLRKVVEAPANLLKSVGINSSQIIRWGEARNVILNEAEDWQADSIYLGARGLGRFKRFLLGSVSSAVASRAKCSVEVIRIKETIE